MEIRRILDYKWRFRIPAELRKNYDGEAFLLVHPKTNCVRIYREFVSGSLKVRVSFTSRTKNDGEDEVKRVLIPEEMRKSTSFFFGKRVLVKDGGDYLELQPRKKIR